MNSDTASYKYFAFISYSRKDSRVAAWRRGGVAAEEAGVVSVSGEAGGDGAPAAA
jgi:hypothetical protein